MTYYICNECCQEVAGPDSICRCQEIKALKEEVTTLRTRAESAERERDEAYAKGQRDRDEEIIQVTKGLTNEVAALAMRVAIRNLPIKERP